MIPIPLDPNLIPEERRRPALRWNATISYKTEQGNHEVKILVLGKDEEAARGEAMRMFNECREAVPALVISEVAVSVSL